MSEHRKRAGPVSFGRSAASVPRWGIRSWAGVALTGALAVALALGGDLPAPRAAQAQVLEPGGVDFPSRRRSFTEGEFQRLPDYCRYMQGYGYDTPIGRQYQLQIGEALHHIHHYCRGLRDMFFARFAPVSAAHRRGLWERALSEIDYMLRNTSQDNPLMPEFWYQRGEVLLALDRVFEAQEALERSRALKPDYWPAYAAWADFLIRSRRLEDARAVVALGLQNAPDAPRLIELRQRLASAR
jgi:tetratricopeptide (TPR) repeat protein